MKETRLCVICKREEFRTKKTSNRKTCCAKCSRQYQDDYKKKLHSSLYQSKKNSQKLEKCLEN